MLRNIFKLAKDAIRKSSTIFKILLKEVLGLSSSHIIESLI